MRAGSVATCLPVHVIEAESHRRDGEGSLQVLLFIEKKDSCFEGNDGQAVLAGRV